MNVSHSNNAHRVRRRRGSGDDQSLMERAQIKAPVEAITERGEIASGVLLEVEGMVTTGQTGLEIAEDGIDPAKLGNLLRLAASHDHRVMAASGFGDGAKASQTIRKHRAGRRQMIFRPGRNGLQGESSHRGQSDADRATRFGQGNGRHEGGLVLRTTPDLAARALSTEVSVIELNFTFREFKLEVQL